MVSGCRSYGSHNHGVRRFVAPEGSGRGPTRGEVKVRGHAPLGGLLSVRDAATMGVWVQGKSHPKRRSGLGRSRRRRYGLTGSRLELQIILPPDSQQQLRVTGGGLLVSGCRSYGSHNQRVRGFVAAEGSGRGPTRGEVKVRGHAPWGGLLSVRDAATMGVWVQGKSHPKRRSGPGRSRRGRYVRRSSTGSTSRCSGPTWR